MRQQIQSRAHDDSALELVLSIGVIGLMALVGSELSGAHGAILSALFGITVFAQGRLSSRNFVIHVPLAITATLTTPTLLPVMYATPGSTINSA